jgi:hypothetical protein
MTEVEDLFLHSNELMALPKSFSLYPSPFLTVSLISFCEFINLFYTLKFFSFSCSSLMIFEWLSWIGEANKLKTIWLSSNKLANLPSSFEVIPFRLHLTYFSR